MTKKIAPGTYLFTGKNFAVLIDSDYGYWTADLYSADNKNIDFLHNAGFENSRFSTKKELIGILKIFDNNEL